MMRFASLFCFFFTYTLLLRAQQPEAGVWVKALSASGPKQCFRSAEMVKQFIQADAVLRRSYWTALKESALSPDNTIAARAYSLQPVLAGLAKQPLNCEEKSTLQESALRLALQTGDEMLLVECLERAGDTYNDCRQNDKALLYLLKACQLRQKKGPAFFPGAKAAALNLGGVFFNAQEYDSCIRYTQKGIREPGAFESNGKLMSALNIIAISAQRLQRFDSAAIWFHKALQTAIDSNLTAWTGIIKGNIGFLKMQQGKYNEALPLMWNDYQVSLEQNDTSNAGNTLQRIARIYSMMGKPDSAVLLAKRAYQFTLHTRRYNNPSHRKNALETLAFVLQKNRLYAEALGTHIQFIQLKDSLDAVLAASRLDRIQLQIDYDKSATQITALQEANRNEKLKRQLLLLALVLLGISGLFFLLWIRQKNKNRQQQLLQEKQLAEAAMQSAQEQLSQFTRHIVEKNELIEQLQQQLMTRQQEVNEDLLKQTILTDEDWRRFREMFTQVHPVFFKTIQQIAPEITAAELRMAAVIKLGLGNKYIASMLGVSGDTVRKSKFRLRQRLPLAEDRSLEDFIMQL